mgnify:CR=1 FL=1
MYLRNLLIIILLHLTVSTYSQVFYYQNPVWNTTYYGLGSSYSYLDKSSQELYVLTTNSFQGSNQTNLQKSFGIIRYDAQGAIVKTREWNLFSNPFDTLIIPQWIGKYQDSLWVAGQLYADSINYIFLGRLNSDLEIISPVIYSLATSITSGFTVLDVKLNANEKSIFYIEFPGNTIYNKTSCYVMSLDNQMQIKNVKEIYSPQLHPKKILFGVYLNSYYDTLLQKQKVFMRAKKDTTHQSPHNIEFHVSVSNIDTATWLCDIDSTKPIWSHDAMGVNSVSAYRGVQSTQFVGYLPYTHTQYLISASVRGTPRYDSMFQSTTLFNAIYIVDRRKDTIIKEIMLPWYAAEDTSIASQSSPPHGGLLRGKNGDYYAVSFELCLQKSRGVVNVHCLDSNLQLKWSRFLVDNTGSYWISKACLDSNDRVLLIGSFRHFDGSGNDLRVFKLDSVGAIFVSTKETEPKQLEEFVFYPNPSKDQFYIKIPSKYTSLTAEIYTLDGRLVHDCIIDDSRKISTSSLAAGSYYAVIKSENQRLIVHKIVKE